MCVWRTQFNLMFENPVAQRLKLKCEAFAIWKYSAGRIAECMHTNSEKRHIIQNDDGIYTFNAITQHYTITCQVH